MAYFQSEEITKSPERSSEAYLDKSSSELVNHLQTEIAKTPGHTIGDFFTKSLWSWLSHYIKSRFGRKFPYPSYQLPETGIYELATDQVTKLAVTSDWATDTPESFDIALEIKKKEPDYTVHVGDTYFVGAPSEINSNFVEQGSPWVRGTTGSFAVLGNHEMYARGDAFFERLLPTLGLRNEAGAYTGQKAGYFCLQNDHWRILGLDTGYHSTGRPIIEFLPGFSPDCRFDDEQMEWLEKTVKLGDKSDKRGLLIFSHHQFISAFCKESEYPKPAQQLASLLGSDRTILWLWGHEHKLAIYGKIQEKSGLSVYGRCIGHGGTPVEVQSKNFELCTKQNGYEALVGFDKRKQKTVNKTDLGYNGYVVCHIDNEAITLDYVDNIGPLLSEKWVADLKTGAIQGKIEVLSDKKLTLASGKSWDNAVQ